MEQDIKTVKDKAKALKIPFINLKNKEIPVNVLKEIPEEAASFYKFVPIAKEENILEVGIVDPENLKAKEALRFITRRSGLESKLYIITEVDFKNILNISV